MNCCQCGIQLPSFSIVLTCRKCLSLHNSATNTPLTKPHIISHCKSCERYLIPPSRWEAFEHKSKDLMGMLLLRVSKFLNKGTKIINAKYLFNEPHSRRITIEVIVESNISDNNTEYNKITQDISLSSGDKTDLFSLPNYDMASSAYRSYDKHTIPLSSPTTTDRLAPFTQDINNKITTLYILTYKIHNKQCPPCQNLEASLFWNTVIQLRFKTINNNNVNNNNRTLLYINHMLIKDKKQDKLSNIKQTKNGYDYFFTEHNSSIKFLKYLEAIIGCKTQNSSKLLSLDTKSNIAKNKHTISVQVLPFIRDDLVFVDNKIIKDRNISNYLLVLKVTTKLVLIDPNTSKTVVVNNNMYWNNEDCFVVIKRSTDLVKMTVIDMNKRDNVSNIPGEKYNSAYVDICNSDYSRVLSVRTHMGKEISNLLTIKHNDTLKRDKINNNTGDSNEMQILGYDIENSGCELLEDCSLNFIIVRVVPFNTLSSSEQVVENVSNESINDKLEESESNSLNEEAVNRKNKINCFYKENSAELNIEYKYFIEDLNENQFESLDILKDLMR
ncbi:60S ribosomal export protein NMD3 [Cucumispora dikerogammari]|nr:60S ribosomal export protein NMD3 [Cucumispora dikerogammari]